jgi:competence protein ComEA
MTFRSIPLVLTIAVTLLGGNAALAADKAKPAASQPAPGQAQASAPSAAAKLVDINNASRAELKALPGIGDVEADRIIKARPYPSKTKLVVDQVIPEPTYQAIKGRVVAEQPAAPKAKSDSKAPPKP